MSVLVTRPEKDRSSVRYFVAKITEMTSACLPDEVTDSVPNCESLFKVLDLSSY